MADIYEAIKAGLIFIIVYYAFAIMLTLIDEFIEGSQNNARQEIQSNRENQNISNINPLYHPEDISTASTAKVKLKKHVRELMCHACRGKEKITFECPICKNYYCAACVFDLHAKCMECNKALNRRA